MSTINGGNEPDKIERTDKGAPTVTSKRHALAPFLAFLLVGFAIHLLVHQLNAVTLEGFPLGYYLAAQGAPIILATIAFWIASRRARAFDTGSGFAAPAQAPLTNGIVASGEILSGAFVVGMTGVLFAQGYDGLAYTLGIMCGLIAMSLFVVPAFEQTSSRSVCAVLSRRHASRSVAIVSAIILGLCLVLLLAAEITVVAIVLSRTMAITMPYAIALAAGLTVIALGVSTIGRSALAVGLALASLAILIVLTVSSGLISWSSFGVPVPQFGYGLSLQEITGLERTMLENAVADAVSLKQHLRPRLHFDAVNFFAIAACMTFGLAVLPLRALTRGGIENRATKVDFGSPALTSMTLALAWCAFFAAATLITLPAVAAFAKLELYRSLAAGIPLSTLPAWVAPYAFSGLVTVCGQSDLGAANLAASCGGTSGTLTLQDIVIHPDAVLLALAEMANQPAAVFWAVAGVVFLFALMGGARLATVAYYEFSDAGTSTNEPLSATDKGANPWRCATVAALMVTIAALIAATARVEIVTLVAWSACLAASTLFPAVVMGHLWPRVGPLAVITAMIAGAAICIYYAVGTTYFPISFAQTWQTISSAPQWRLEEMAGLNQSCDAGKLAQCAQLRVLAVESANWFGIQNTASALFAMPVAFCLLAVLSAIFPHGRHRT